MSLVMSSVCLDVFLCLCFSYVVRSFGMYFVVSLGRLCRSLCMYVCPPFVSPSFI